MQKFSNTNSQPGNVNRVLRDNAATPACSGHPRMVHGLECGERQLGSATCWGFRGAAICGPRRRAPQHALCDPRSRSRSQAILTLRMGAEVEVSSRSTGLL